MPRRMQRRAWGNINEVVKGKKYVLRWTQNTPQGRKKPCETFYGTYREACARMSELELLHGKSKPVPTVGDVCRMWYLPWLDKRVEDGKTKEGTAFQYRRLLELTILPKWADTPVDSIRPLDVQTWLMSMTKSDAERSIVVARKIIDFPVQYEIVPSNKFRQVYEMPRTNKVNKRRDTFDLAKANEVFAKVHGDMCESSIILALFGSARLGESLGVRRAEVERVEYDGMVFAVVPIRRRVPLNGSDVLPDGDLKTPQSLRDLIIPEPYSTRLLEIAETGIVPESEWLAPQHNGGTMSCGQLKWYWKRVAGEDHIPISNLRTSWRTFAQYEWNVDYDTCEVLMGHRLKGVTGHHYLRPTREQLLENVAKGLKSLRQN